MRDWYDIIPMSQIDHRLYVGGRKACADLVADNPLGITAVLNVHTDPDEKQVPGIMYKHVPFDDGYAIPEDKFIVCLGWLKARFEEGHVIYVHCAAGISRSVTILASFMHVMGIADFDDALYRIKQARPVANPAPATLLSAKKMLGVWPYDGSMEAQPEHEQQITEAFSWMDANKLAQVHIKRNCPMRLFLLADDPNDNRPRHEIPCTCDVLNEDGM